MPETLRGDQVELRPLAPGDRARLREILQQPDVAERWLGSRTLDGLVDELFAVDDHNPLVIAIDGELVGYVQYFETRDPDYRSASIDLFVDGAHQGRGIGPDALRTLIRHLIRDRGHHRITIDPAVSNERAIRAYERVGFRPVGVMRAYERGPDGTWHDGLLMDLLAIDLEADSAADGGEQGP